MTVVIGIDEAGYGPNLGPLVIGGSVWKLEDEPATATDRFASLTDQVTADWRAGSGPPWGDSKKVFSRTRTGSPLEPLERGVLTAVLARHAPLPTTGGDLLRLLGLSLPDDASHDCWHELSTMLLPQATVTATCQQQADTIHSRCQPRGIRLLSLACRWIFPAAFNASLDTGCNKSDILSQLSLGLAAELLQQQPATEAIIWCDRHGGRKRYAGVVSHCFAAARVEPISETATQSRYLIHARGPKAHASGQPTTSISFSVGGESQLPVAVASMTAKYIRELAMGAFNRFWTDQQPGLMPTAGYPVDARRWWQETAARREQLGLADPDLWRRA
jgi:ribonuclease HII